MRAYPLSSSARKVRLHRCWMAAGLGLGKVARRPAVDAVFLLILHAPLHAVGRDALGALGHVGEEELPDRHRLQRLIAQNADVDLAAFDVLLDDRRGVDALVDEGDALLELLVAVDDGRLGDADRRFLRQRFHDQRKRQPLRPPDRAPDAEDLELRHRDAVVGEQLLGQRLVARHQQAARIAAGVGQLQQLEVARRRSDRRS